jgi:hypothetical protein
MQPIWWWKSSSRHLQKLSLRYRPRALPPLRRALRSTQQGDANERRGKGRTADGGAASGADGASSAGISPIPPASVPVSIDAAFGQAVWLMMNTPAYRYMFLSDLERMVLPPIMLGQLQVSVLDGRAVAFAAWASLSEAAEARLQEPNPRPLRSFHRSVCNPGQLATR